jgi:hypothetical protein
MDKIKEKLHIGSSRRKSQAENDAFGSGNVGTIEGTYTFMSMKLYHQNF